MNPYSIALGACALAIAALPSIARADGTVDLASMASVDPASVPASVPSPSEGAPPVHYEDTDQVLLPGDVTHGGYGGPVVKFTTMTNEGAVLVGGEGGWIINHSLIIGGAGYGLATVHDAPPALSPPVGRSTLQLGYGGPRLAFVIRPHDVVHVTLATLIGGGGYTILTRYDALDDHKTHDSQAFFVLEPEVQVEVNLLKFLRAGVGVSYRYIGTESVPGLATSDLSGPSGSVVIKAGAF